MEDLIVFSRCTLIKAGGSAKAEPGPDAARAMHIWGGDVGPKNHGSWLEFFPDGLVDLLAKAGVVAADSCWLPNNVEHPLVDPNRWVPVLYDAGGFRIEI